MVNIPLELLNLQDDGFHLLMEVVVFGHPFKAVLDTGDSRTVFDKSTVEQHLSNDVKIHHTDMMSTGLGTNTMESFSLVIPDLILGRPPHEEDKSKQALHLRNFEVAILDLSTINHAYLQMEMEPVIGVIGGDILINYGGIIDYRKLTLKLGERKMRRNL